MSLDFLTEPESYDEIIFEPPKSYKTLRIGFIFQGRSTGRLLHGDMNTVLRTQECTTLSRRSEHCTVLNDALALVSFIENGDLNTALC